MAAASLVSAIINTRKRKADTATHEEEKATKVAKTATDKTSRTTTATTTTETTKTTKEIPNSVFMCLKYVSWGTSDVVKLMNFTHEEYNGSLQSYCQKLNFEDALKQDGLEEQYCSCDDDGGDQDACIGTCECYEKLKLFPLKRFLTAGQKQTMDGEYNLITTIDDWPAWRLGAVLMLHLKSNVNATVFEN